MPPRSVLITGTSSGFGYLTALTLARRGHAVFATMRDAGGRNAQKAAGLRAMAALDGATLEVLELDVTDPASIEDAVARAVSVAGRLDVVVNNAGVFAAGLTEAFPADQMASLFETNVFGPQRVARAALPHMRRQGSGLLVWISSVMARFSIPYAAAYGASKAALESLAEGYRYELAPLGIDSIIVEPGGHLTGAFAGMMTPADQERICEYGALAGMPDQVFGGFAQMLHGPDAPQPQGVADAIARLIAAPAGARPLRMVIDPLTGQHAAALNVVSEDIQQQVLGGLGLAELLQPRAAA